MPTGPKIFVALIIAILVQASAARADESEWQPSVHEAVVDLFLPTNVASPNAPVPASALQIPQGPETHPTPASTGFRSLAKDTMADFVAFTKRPSTWVILGIGAGAAGLSHPADSTLHDNRHYLSDVVFGAALGTATGWTIVGRHGRETYALMPVPVRHGMAVSLIRVDRRSAHGGGVS